MNSAAGIYGGSGVGCFGVVDATPEQHNGRPFSAYVTLPPLGVVFLRSKTS